jgi:palmitoyltransferase ZDHHC9/14/18
MAVKPPSHHFAPMCIFIDSLTLSLVVSQIRNSAHKSIVPGTAPPNPFAHSSWRGNLADVLCRPSGFSWVQAHAVATEDKRLVNPGFADFVVHDDAEGDDTHQRA